MPAKAILKRKLISYLNNKIKKNRIKTVSNSKLVVKNTVSSDWANKQQNELKVTQWCNSGEILAAKKN